MFDLLTDRFIEVETLSRGQVNLSLPGLYERLMADDVASLPKLRAHQEHAAHAFLTQLAAIGTHAGGLSSPPTKEAEWREMLSNLTAGHDMAWNMLAMNPGTAAFMQPPIPNWDDISHKTLPCPDDLDVAITASKNHDFKQSVAWGADVAAWIWPLIAMQTEGAYQGAMTYGVARISSGYGSRSCFASVPAGVGIGARIKRDVDAMLKVRDDFSEQYTPYVTKGGRTLLWLEPWNGHKDDALKPEGFDPYFIEVCRMVRLNIIDRHIIAEKAGSKTPRIAASVNGKRIVFGDFWMPVWIDKKERSIGMMRNTLRYDRLRDVLFGDKWRLPPALSIEGEDSPQLMATGVAKGGSHGASEGYWQRRDVIVPIGSEADRETYREVSDALIAYVRGVMNALKGGLHAYLTAHMGRQGIEVRPAGDVVIRRAEPYLNRFQAAIDRRYFDDLRKCTDSESGESALADFKAEVTRIAEGILETAFEELPKARHQRTCAEVQAVRVFMYRVNRLADEKKDDE